MIEDEEALANEAIFPTEETISKCESLRMLDQDVTDLYSKYWKQVKADWSGPALKNGEKVNETG